MADLNGLQLLPETRRKIEVKVPGENKLLYSGGAILALAIILISGLTFYQNSLESTLTQINTDLTNLEQQRDKKAEQNILVLNKQLSLISKLLDNHLMWSNALDKIGKLLENQVQFETFSANAASQKIDFKALALNYTVIAKQIASFNSDNSISNVTLSNVHTLTTGRLEFDMRIDFDGNKFLK